ncbi:MAG: hypothetical protein Q8930_05670 [Bacillota bacterium]|nr:hypothetical protein [Bacillota bacterium]
MSRDKLAKIAGLNIGIAAADTIIFSPGLLGIQLGGAGVLGTAFGATAILMSAIIFVYGNYSLLSNKQIIIHTSEIKTSEDCILALKEGYRKKTFEKDISMILEQIERFQKKKEVITDILLQKFNSTEMSYSKFESTIAEVENIFFINIKSIINKLNAFDEEEYSSLQKNNLKGKLSSELMNTKMAIYNEYISYVVKAIEDNEEILIKLDKLLLEVSRFNSLEDGEIEKMPAILSLDELIDRTKLYKS